MRSQRGMFSNRGSAPSSQRRGRLSSKKAGNTSKALVSANRRGTPQDPRIVVSHLSDRDDEFVERNFGGMAGLEEFEAELTGDPERKVPVQEMIDNVFTGIEGYAKKKGLRNADLFRSLDKHRVGFFCSTLDLMHRLTEMGPALKFNFQEVEAFIMSMEKDNSMLRSGGEKKAQHRKDVRITFDEFNRALQKFRRRHYPKRKAANKIRSPVKPKLKQSYSSPTKAAPSSAAKARARAGRKSVQSKAASDSRVRTRRLEREADMQDAETRQQTKVAQFKQSAQRNLKAHLGVEKRKRQKLARKLAAMTLSAVEAEVEAITSEAVPSDELTVSSTAQERKFLEGVSSVQDEYNHLHKKQHYFGSHMSEDVSGGGLWFGTYTPEMADKMLEAEQMGEHTDPSSLAHTHLKSGQYADRKLHQSEIRLLQAKDELAKTRKAKLDARREVELGKHELEQRAAELQNMQYKVKCLLRMLKEILPTVLGKGKGGAAAAASMALSPGRSVDARGGGTVGMDSMAEAASTEETLDDSTDLPAFIQSKMNSIASTLPLWSKAFDQMFGQTDDSTAAEALLTGGATGSPGTGRKAIPPRVRQQLEKYISEYREQMASGGSPSFVASPPFDRSFTPAPMRRLE